MNQPHSWEEELSIVLQELGGEAHYADIYQRIEERGVMNLSSSWKSVVRGCMERFSSDSMVHTGEYGGIRDRFYSVNGIGQGSWGFRGYEGVGANNITEDDNGFPEGKKKLKTHVARERNPQVVREAKENYKAEQGRVYCEVCGFDFYQTYGEVGEDFIEGHHTIPVSEMQEGDVTRPEDIALVCSNCHRMLHRKRPWLTKEHLSRVLDR